MGQGITTHRIRRIEDRVRGLEDAPVGDGSGDMLVAIYDPTSIEDDAFDMDNMVEGTNTKILTAAERTAISTIGSSGGDTTYRIFTQPSTTDTNGLVVYTGFATDLDALTSGASWAVKKMLQAGTETWAGKTTFDEILDDYLTLTYS